MVLGKGKPGVCLDNNFAGHFPPDPAGPDRINPPVRDSSSCHYFAIDGDCIANFMRCWYCRAHGLCIVPSATPPIKFRVVS
jgi:hypothetical protein